MSPVPPPPRWLGYCWAQLRPAQHGAAIPTASEHVGKKPAALLTPAHGRESGKSRRLVRGNFFLPHFCFHSPSFLPGFSLCPVHLPPGFCFHGLWDASPGSWPADWIWLGDLSLPGTHAASFLSCSEPGASRSSCPLARRPANRAWDLGSQCGRHGPECDFSECGGRC